MTIREVTSLLTDESSSWGHRLARLQGWSGADAECAAAAPAAQRVGPAVCAVGAFVGAATQSPVVLAIFAGTAAIGAVARNHPFEVVYNRWAASRGRPTLPANRAAKRLGCATGVIFLGVAAIAFASGATVAGLALALVLGATATFVAVTGICVPSIVFTAVWGVERASAPGLFSGIGTGRHPTKANSRVGT